MLCIRVVPNARKTQCAGLMDDGETLRVRLAAPAVENKANEALTRWLANSLGLHRNAVRITSGEKSRKKRVQLHGVTREHALACLLSSRELH